MATRAPARCRQCTRPVVFFRSPFTSKIRTFEPKPIDGRHDLAVTAFPVLGRSAYKFAVLVDLIQVQRECTADEAEAEVRDMPWHFPHDCDTPTTTDTEETP